MKIVRAGARLAATSAAALGLGMGTASAGLVLTVENAGVQQTSVSGVTTESFDGFSRGWTGSLATAVGVITSGNMQINEADQYGAAGGEGNYLAVGGGDSPTTLAFAAPQSYFGFWWSAADGSNAFSIYSGSTLLGNFNPGTALDALSYHYKGNPTSPFYEQDYGEKFAYLNFFGTGGTTFDRVVFTNYNSGSRLELDNFSIRAAAVDNPPGTGLEGFHGVPEPSSLALASIAAAAAVGFSRRRGRR